MEPIIRDYIEKLFAFAPKTKQAYELKEEIIRNTIERYHDLIDEGKNDGDAYNQAIAGIGDINELIDELKSEESFETKPYTENQLETVKKRKGVFLCVAVALYILCVAPCIIGAESDNIIGAAIMFFMLSVATGLLIYGSMTKRIPIMTEPAEIKDIKQRAAFRAVGIGLYISCVTPVIISYGFSNSTVSVVFTFLMIAAATVLVILSRNKNTYTKADDTMVESFKEWNSQKKHTSKLYKIITAIIWVTAAAVFLLLIFAVSIYAVAVAWIVFLIALSVQKLVKAIFDYMEAGK